VRRASWVRVRVGVVGSIGAGVVAGRVGRIWCVTPGMRAPDGGGLVAAGVVGSIGRMGAALEVALDAGAALRPNASAAVTSAPNAASPKKIGIARFPPG